MKVIVAEYAGFCFGVSRAVETVEKTVLEYPEKKISTIGKIIHNPTVVRRFEEAGVSVIDEGTALGLAESEEAKNTVAVIRTHGIRRELSVALEALAEKEPGFRVVDCTCPYVKKIHKIVSEQSSKDGITFIFGNENHPEVEGIRSYVNGKSFTFSSAEALKALLSGLQGDEKDVLMVSQTTQNVAEWKKCQEILQKLYTNAKIFDTICSVTGNRQSETEKLSRSVDVMLVIGGRDSSNTSKLYETAKKNCPATFMIESAKELSLSGLPMGDDTIIGITAGASTPADIIEEVKTIMSVEINSEENFAQMLEDSLKTLNTGETVKGIVTSVLPNEIHVDTGTKVTGIIAYDDLTDEPGLNLADLFHPGDEIEAVALRVSDLDGVATLSKKKVDSKNNWEKIKAAYESGEILEGKVVDAVKGGYIVRTLGNRLFMPATQTAYRRDTDASEIVGKTERFKVIDVNDERRRAVVSARVVAKEERAAKEEAFWGEMEEGKVYHGTVKSFTSYGAFVDLGSGIDGMIHTSELSWTRIKHPSEVLAIGDEVEVYIKDFSREKRRISLGYKTDATNPWTLFTAQYAIGDTAEVKIVSMMPFGAFAEIIPGVDGLIHISQIANKKIAKPADVLTIGETVQVKIVDIDTENKKVSLSIRALLDEEERANYEDMLAESEDEASDEDDAE